jgi:N-methylhydantoinase B
MNSGMANGSFPATLGEDGFNSSGVFFVPGMEASNVEENEMAYPLLTLYRRHNRAGAAGAGFHRSGLGVEEAWVMHGTDRINLEIYNNESFTKCQGLMGGNPGGRAFFRVRKNTDVRSQFEYGIVPQNIDDLAGEEIGLIFKGPRIVVGVDDIWSTNAPNTAGYGDPLDRDAAAVVTDVADGRMTVADAEEVYGVIINNDGLSDTENTLLCRERQRAFRSGKERKK